MGLFGVSEVIASVRTVRTGDVTKVSFWSMVPTRDDMRRFLLPTLRGTTVGCLFGVLPGTGGTIATFLAYGLEKKVAREPERFGKGAVEGVIAPEAANNAADQTAFIPTLTLGVPGSPTMALMLGVLLINGITPGPRFVTQQPDMFWGLIMSFWIGNLILLILNLPLIGLWVRLLKVPYRLMYPAILLCTCIGVYSIRNSPFDVATMVAFGALGYGMRLLGFPAAPLLLGFVLGPIMEEHFRRAMLLSRGDFMTFFERPISGTIMAIVAVILLWGLWGTLKELRRRSVVAA
jgi:TctA family transporter